MNLQTPEPPKPTDFVRPPQETKYVQEKKFDPQQKKERKQEKPKEPQPEKQEIIEEPKLEQKVPVQEPQPTANQEYLFFGELKEDGNNLPTVIPTDITIPPPTSNLVPVLCWVQIPPGGIKEIIDKGYKYAKFPTTK
ncbi:hypothetical protein TVAGG3_0616700 [Trichomonas vaginalis G3]|uniref:hypothetical protein n=1 Tax=Trichomonas vaginalis (strain ATCC PRA-98 / G3) TaxID=412133 RepID=UPI0021E572C8|nr:hypothetical protein TVAGG3_0616700 [Trichomonas vaginalis G3]KAI5503600.1 hypothetical protein TVAGG3_0616700 [Trichomonas vaginalis G3]